MASFLRSAQKDKPLKREPITGTPPRILLAAFKPSSAQPAATTLELANAPPAVLLTFSSTHSHEFFTEFQNFPIIFLLFKLLLF
jgi:hypothetical protein